MIDLVIGWRGCPGMFSPEDGYAIQQVVKQAPKGTAHVELGAWCGRSLAAACEVLPEGAVVYSYDNYLDDSEAADGAPIPAKTAKALRELVRDFYRKAGKQVFTVVSEASAAGGAYAGPPIHSLLVDDHHTAEQVEANIKAWGPRMAAQSVMAFHDYSHPPYRIKETCERLLPPLGYKYGAQVSGLGLWERVP